MKGAFLRLVLLISIFGENAQAQNLILQKFVQKANSFKNVSYVSITNNESPFGDNSDTILVYQNIGPSKIALQFAAESGHFKEAYADESLLNIDLDNKFYSVNKDYRYADIYRNSNPLFKLRESLFVFAAISPKPRA